MSLSIKSDLAKAGRAFAYKQIALMIVLVFVITLITYFYWGLSYAQSALAGGVVIIIPNFVFALKAFRYSGARSSQKVMASFNSGAKIKLVLTAVLFSLVFKFFAIAPVPFFTSFCLILAMPLFTPFFIKH